ncbi:hypothetical protein [Sporisorium scitamineum]|uniref:Uncharacterized protein n=1 Tax=Sporisorium scitamineum TaxID=49012 RepID=A0A0F7RWC3_9BASI|nr:hypothetical protein [Sporisorium scitamineum]
MSVAEEDEERSVLHPEVTFHVGSSLDGSLLTLSSIIRSDSVLADQLARFEAAKLASSRFHQ